MSLNLFGTNNGGGSNYSGNVFELTKDAHGIWKETQLYSFLGGTDGRFPQGPLTLDRRGNIYGATSAGGFSAYGVIFQLVPQTGGLWTENTLHSFQGSPGDGQYPNGGFLFDSTGNLYGTTQYGSSNLCDLTGCGIAFSLALQSDGSWQEAIVHNFTGRKDGANPNGGLFVDSSGNVLGAGRSGKYNSGVVFKISR
jgi:hypothetical protein